MSYDHRRYSTPTGRGISIPAAQYLRQQHGAEKEMEKIIEAARAAGLAVVGDEILAVDYSEIELRLLAAFKGD